MLANLAHQLQDDAPLVIRSPRSFAPSTAQSASRKTAKDYGGLQLRVFIRNPVIPLAKQYYFCSLLYSVGKARLTLHFPKFWPTDLPELIIR